MEKRPLGMTLTSDNADGDREQEGILKPTEGRKNGNVFNKGVVPQVADQNCINNDYKNEHKKQFDKFRFIVAVCDQVFEHFYFYFILYNNIIIFKTHIN